MNVIQLKTAQTNNTPVVCKDEKFFVASVSVDAFKQELSKIHDLYLAARILKRHYHKNIVIENNNAALIAESFSLDFIIEVIDYCEKNNTVTVELKNDTKTIIVENTEIEEYIEPEVVIQHTTTKKQIKNNLILTFILLLISFIK